jgi:coenzyme F420-reducing hydrogenase alpha subunit
LNHDELTPVARDAAAAAGLAPGERNTFRSIVVRAVEILHACDMGLALIDRYQAPDHPAIEVQPRAGVGYGWTEAPRGMLWHRYEIDDDGSILSARIVPPTSQNQAGIERDLFHFVEENLDLSDDELGHRAEQVIRSYDPCISCATHFLDVTIDRS